VLRKFLWLFLILPSAVALITFAVANRHPVRLTLDPITPDSPYLAFEAPLFLLLFAALCAGLLLGGCATWFTQRKWRRRARKRSIEAARLRRETDQLNQQLRAAARPKLEAASAAE
jgi:uncharacterized integral membrane protein